MKRILIKLGVIAALLLTAACGSTAGPQDIAQQTNKISEIGSLQGKRLKITVNGHILFAELENNATARDFARRLPVTLRMENLYGREMCYRYGAGGLAEAAPRSDGYEVGDIAYWPPRGSLVILYKQNGERFERVQMGHIERGTELFADGEDAEVKFELAE